MKKRIIITIAILIITPNVNAWDDCPFGLENESYPGTCPRYIDTNNDGICDHSQSEPVTEMQENEVESKAPIQNTSDEKNSNKFPIMLVISFIFVFGLILFFRYLTKRKKISNSQEKIIWNIFLLIFFLPSAITGIILLLMTNLGLLRDLGLSFIQLHNITSLFFMWISGYHIIWHTKYYTNSVKKIVTQKKQNDIVIQNRED